MRIFVAGTDTGVGKTVVSAILALKLGAKYWKPVQSGHETDSDWVARALGHEGVYTEAYALELPLSPHESARRQGVRIELNKILTLLPPGPLVVEGAGGIFTPLNETYLMVDLMAALALPTVLVARSGLGTINHTLLTLEALRRRNCKLQGVVLVGPDHPANLSAIEHYGRVSVLGRVPWMNELSPETLVELGANLNLENEKCKSLAY